LSAIPVGGSIGALTLGASAFFASIISPVSPEKVLVEPAFLQNLERNQKLGVFVKLYKSVYLVQQSSSFNYSSERSSIRAFVKGGIIRTVSLGKKEEKFAELLLVCYPIRWDEASTIAAALQIGVDRIYLTRPAAREVAKKLKVGACGPIMFYIESFMRGLISRKDFEDAVMNELGTGSMIN